MAGLQRLACNGWPGNGWPGNGWPGNGWPAMGNLLNQADLHMEGNNGNPG